MDLERVGHEILTVEVVNAPSGPATIKRHYALYGHLHIGVPGPAAVGAPITLNVELLTWDTQELVTDMDRPVEILVNDQPMCTVELVGGRAAAEITLPKTGTYSVRVAADRVTDAAIEVVANA
jgi:hypothetical protein